MLSSLRIAVLFPCYNEETAIPFVIKEFQAVLPEAEIYVIDNNSKDKTAETAQEAGATVLTVKQQGKGHAVRRAFADIDADIYVMADGDGTYEAAKAPEMVERLVAEDLDMVVGIRIDEDVEAYRKGHRAGNRLFNMTLRALFGTQFTDIFSGYRIFSKRFVKSFPALSKGFEIETELSVHALVVHSATAEIKTRYGARMEGSESKLQTYRDGFKILWRLLLLAKDLKPLFVFGAAAIVSFLISLGLGIPVILAFLETGLVEKLPTAVLAASLSLLSAMFLVCGLTLSTVSRLGNELKRLHYLQHPSLGETARKNQTQP